MVAQHDVVAADVVGERGDAVHLGEQARRGDLALGLVDDVGQGARDVTRDQVRDGAESVVGARAKVTQTVDTHGGRIILGSDEWSALAQLPYDVYPVGARVVIVEIRGAHAIVAADAIES